MAAAIVVEYGFKAFNISREPKILPYSIALLNKSVTLDISAAQKDLGYKPEISIKEGLREFIQWWKSKDI